MNSRGGRRVPCGGGGCDRARPWPTPWRWLRRVNPCATASSASCRPIGASCSWWATGPRCCRSAPAGSSSTPSSAPSGSRSWPRWTAPSSSRPTPIASPGPTCISCPTPPSPPSRPARATAPPSAWRGRSTCRWCRCRPQWDSSRCTGATPGTSCRTSAVCTSGCARPCRPRGGSASASTQRSPRCPPSRSPTR